MSDVFHYKMQINPMEFDRMMREEEVRDHFKNGSCYDIDGKVFWEWAMPYEGREPQEPYKSYYTSRDSSVPVTFPYTVPDNPIYEYRHSDAEPRTPAQNENGFL